MFRNIVILSLISFLFLEYTRTDALSFYTPSFFNYVIFVNEIVTQLIWIALFTWFLFVNTKFVWVALSSFSALYLFMGTSDEFVRLGTTLHRDGVLQLINHPYFGTFILYVLIAVSIISFKPKSKAKRIASDQLLDK